MTEILDRTKDEEKSFTTLFQWQCKAMQIYGSESVKGDFEGFKISLSEDYYISFIKPFEVQIEIAMDLKDIAKRLYSDVSEQNDWI